MSPPLSYLPTEPFCPTINAELCLKLTGILLCCLVLQITILFEKNKYNIPSLDMSRCWREIGYGHLGTAALACDTLTGQLQNKAQPHVPFLLGLLLHDMTMAGLQELRFPEEKPLLRGQDVTELVSHPFQVLGPCATLWWRGKLRVFPQSCRW